LRFAERADCDWVDTILFMDRRTADLARLVGSGAVATRINQVT
jgi:hypothetical protein